MEADTAAAESRQFQIGLEVRLFRKTRKSQRRPMQLFVRPELESRLLDDVLIFPHGHRRGRLGRFSNPRGQRLLRIDPPAVPLQAFAHRSLPLGILRHSETHEVVDQSLALLGRKRGSGSLDFVEAHGRKMPEGMPSANFF